MTLVHQHAAGVAQVVGQLLGVLDFLERFNAQEAALQNAGHRGVDLVNHGEALHAADDGLHDNVGGAHVPAGGTVPADQQFGVQVGAEDVLDRGRNLVVEDEKLLIGNMSDAHRVLLTRVEERV